LKTKGESELALCAGADDAPVMDENRQLHPVPGGCFSWPKSMTIRRVGDKPVPVRVLVNGSPLDLPAIQAERAPGSFASVSDERDEFFFLDDERNPLTLMFRLGIGKVPALDPETRKKCEIAKTQGGLTLNGDNPPSCDLPDGGDRDVLRVTKIETRCDAPHRPAAGTDGGADALEKALAESGKVDVYTIYFSFNSDKLREESQPTLGDIAEVMRRHPDWKLQVNGHTDGIGSDEFNVDLSKRRAASVKDALIKQHGVKASRLATAGYGKSQPKDTNDTIEGRARNRRVELTRS
jgi:outer membrane protein OmpA-like peptidoglycan-associated protein